MAYPIEFTEEFELWWNSLTAKEQKSIALPIRLLEQTGMNLARPYADTLYGSKFKNLKELRCQHESRPYRILFAFDPRRIAMLLIGGDKTGRPDWYREFIPKAEKIYAQHLKEIEKE